MNEPQRRVWRDEPVLLIFIEHGSEFRSLNNKPVGDWVVQPGRKPASPGQTITWKAVPPDATLELHLPNVMNPRHVTNKGSVSAKVVSEVPGRYLYEVLCNGQLATAGSSPEIIIDP